MNRSSTKIDVVEDVELGQVHKCNQEVHYWHTGQDVSRQTYLVVQLQQSAPSFITKGNHEKPIKLTPPQTFPQPDVSASPFLAQKKVTAREIEVLTIATQNQSVSGTSQSCFQQNWDIPEVGYTSQDQKWEIISPSVSGTLQPQKLPNSLS